LLLSVQYVDMAVAKCNQLLLNCEVTIIIPLKYQMSNYNYKCNNNYYITCFYCLHFISEYIMLIEVISNTNKISRYLIIKTTLYTLWVQI
jgi:hypothetical protein